MYHDWKVPCAFICPKEQKSAKNAPKTVSQAAIPPSEGGSISLETDDGVDEPVSMSTLTLDSKSITEIDP